jgi:hypothetical protein
LDKRVNISIILALIGQMIVAAWYASKIDSRIYTVERDVASLQRREDARTVVDQKIASDLSALAAAQKAMQGGIERIERGIDAQRTTRQ